MFTFELVILGTSKVSLSPILIDKIESAGYQASLITDVTNPSGKVLQILDGSGNAVETAASNFSSLAGFTITEGDFSINGQTFEIDSTTTIDDLVFEINKAVKEAEQFAEEDKKRKEKVENKNKLDGMIFSVEQTMKEAGDKLDENDKATLQAAIDAAKTELASDDDDRIKAAYDKLMQDVQPVFAKMYQAAGGANPGADPNADGGDTEFHQ